MHKRMVEIINSSKVPPVLRWKMCNSFSSYLEDSPLFFFPEKPMCVQSSLSCTGLEVATDTVAKATTFLGFAT